MLITSWALIVWPRSWFLVVGLCEISSGPAPSQRMTRDDMLKHSMSLPTFETLVTLQPVTLRQTLHSLCVQRGRKKAELEELLDSEANSRARNSENAMNNAMKWIVIRWFNVEVTFPSCGLKGDEKRYFGDGSKFRCKKQFRISSNNPFRESTFWAMYELMNSWRGFRQFLIFKILGGDFFIFFQWVGTT